MAAAVRCGCQYPDHYLVALKRVSTPGPLSGPRSVAVATFRYHRYDSTREWDQDHRLDDGRHRTELDLRLRSDEGVPDKGISSSGQRDNVVRHRRVGK